MNPSPFSVQRPSLALIAAVLQIVQIPPCSIVRYAYLIGFNETSTVDEPTHETSNGDHERVIRVIEVCGESALDDDPLVCGIIDENPESCWVCDWAVCEDLQYAWASSWIVGIEYHDVPSRYVLVGQDGAYGARYLLMICADMPSISRRVSIVSDL